MKGVIFNLFEAVFTGKEGEDAWDDLLARANVSGAYTAVGSYPDEELVSIVQTAATTLGQPPDDVVRWLGRDAIPLLAQRYPVFFDAHTSTIPFLLTLNDVIHPEVRKLFPGAYAPTFEFDQPHPNVLAIGYHSYRDLCPLAEGLVLGAADHYGERVTIEQSECTRRGADRCVLVCTFQAPPHEP